MIIWVWARDPDQALEKAYECKEYTTLREATKADPRGDDTTYDLNLFKIEVTEEVEE